MVDYQLTTFPLLLSDSQSDVVVHCFTSSPLLLKLDNVLALVLLMEAELVTSTKLTVAAG